MAKSGKKKPTARKTASLAAVRKGGTTVQVTNSGLEVWLYDDANLASIRGAKGSDQGFGGMPPGFEAKTQQGQIVGYSLYQDDEVHLAVFVGKPFSEKELSAARWLEPQTAFLRLPSGALCIESNDASRVGPEYRKEHAAEGGRVLVPPGDYRLTLYRIDHEALDREGLTWEGPQEVVVLTPGGSPKDAAAELLPFQHRRDTSWVGRYKIEGRRAEALAWFDDYWDTYILNLDAPALEKLGLKPGGYVRTHVPAAGLTLVSSFAASWDDARRLPPPAGMELDEYGYAALTKMSEWDGAEAFFGRRDATKKRVEDEHHHLWLPAVVEVLDVRPQERLGPELAPAQLEKKTYYDAGFLGMVLSEVLPEVADLEELPLPAALKRLDKKFDKMGLQAQGDRCWEERRGALTVESCVRFYTGLSNAFAVIWAGEGVFHLIFLSELEDRTWILTGLADDLERLIKKRGPTGLYMPNPQVQFEAMDEPLAKIFSAHKAALKKAASSAVSAPVKVEDCMTAFERFRKAAFA
ncbi:MAG: hypothetical protein AMXMBFR7_14400 [Planctomycetota bacterium]